MLGPKLNLVGFSSSARVFSSLGWFSSSVWAITFICIPDKVFYYFTREMVCIICLIRVLCVLDKPLRSPLFRVELDLLASCVLLCFGGLCLRAPKSLGSALYWADFFRDWFLCRGFLLHWKKEGTPYHLICRSSMCENWEVLDWDVAARARLEFLLGSHSRVWFGLIYTL